MFFLSPIPFPALTTLSDFPIGVSRGIPTVKSYPSAFNAATNAATFSLVDPSLNIIFFLGPVTGPFFFLATATASDLGAFPIKCAAITTL